MKVLQSTGFLAYLSLSHSLSVVTKHTLLCGGVSSTSPSLSAPGLNTTPARDLVFSQFPLKAEEDIH